MKYLMIATAILFTTITTTNNICKATIETKITYPQQRNSVSYNPTYNKTKYNNKQPIDMKNWLNWVLLCSKKYGVDPYFALAVAETESSNRNVRFRFNRIGRTYYGPMGIHKCFLKKWNISDPYVNTEVGIRALARYGSQKKALKKYNASFNMAYYRRIKHLEHKNRQSKIFDLKPDKAQLLVYKSR